MVMRAILRLERRHTMLFRASLRLERRHTMALLASLAAAHSLFFSHSHYKRSGSKERKRSEGVGGQAGFNTRGRGGQPSDRR
jgi:hypothetical protein